METITSYTIGKDIIGLIGGIATLAIAGIGLALALAQWKAATEEQRLQRRWKQADKGRKLVDDLFESNDADQEYYAWDAMKALDYVDSKPPYQTKTVPKLGKGVDVTSQAIQAALKPTELTEANPADLYLRECFDEFYFKMAQFQDAIDNGLVEFRHVEFPINYYIGLMVEDRKDAELHGKYLKKFGYEKTLKFLNNFPRWRAAVDSLASSTVTAR